MTVHSFFRKLQAVTPAKPKSNVHRMYHAGFGLPLYYVKKNEKKAKSAVAAAKKKKPVAKKSPLVGKVAVLKQELKQAKAQLQLVLTAAETAAAKKAQQPQKRHVVVNTVSKADPRIAEIMTVIGNSLTYLGCIMSSGRLPDISKNALEKLFQGDEYTFPDGSRIAFKDARIRVRSVSNEANKRFLLKNADLIRYIEHFINELAFARMPQTPEPVVAKSKPVRQMRRTPRLVDPPKK